MITNDNAAVNAIITMAKETTNPLESELDPNNLYNVGTGKAASESTKNLLLNIEQMEILKEQHLLASV